MSNLIVILFLLIFGIATYLVPTIVALATGNNRTKVILFNIFLGWTIVMWIITLVWACKKPIQEN